MKFIDRLKLVQFRCHAESEIILNHMTIIAGPNNSGKTALLNSIRRLPLVNETRYLDPQQRQQVGDKYALKLMEFDKRLNATDTAIVFEVNRDAMNFLMRSGSWNHRNNKRYPVQSLVDSGFDRDTLQSLRGDTFKWPLPVHIYFKDDGQTYVEIRAYDEIDVEDVSRNDRWNVEFNSVYIIECLPVVVIPEIREIGLEHENKVSDFANFSEEIVLPDSLLRNLLTWYHEDRERFDHYEICVTHLLSSSFHVTFQPSRELLMVSIGGDDPRPLQEVGSGITSIMNLAMALTKYRGGLLLFEEPELHLHPRLQRQVTSYLLELVESGDWQVILTTHSNHILDFAANSIVSVHATEWRKQGASVRNLTSAQIHDAISALGARPSSLLESNCLIWVEGPSDAIYIKFFLTEYFRRHSIKLREFTDYSFSFFGGAILAHMSFQDAPVKTLFDIMSIRRNSYIVLDSDRASNDDPLGKKYARDFISDRVLADRYWITNGREIENYLDDLMLDWAVSGTLPTSNGTSERLDNFRKFSAQMDELASARGQDRCSHPFNSKVAFALSAVEAMRQHPDVDWLRRTDLFDKVAALVKFIKTSIQ